MEKVQKDRDEYKKDCQSAERQLDKVKQDLEKQIEKGKLNATKVV